MAKIELTDEKIKRKIDEAIEIMGKAYVPYSKFPVAAILIDENGKTYKGVNVENASYGLGLCAERNAITSAVTDGMKKIHYIVVVADTKGPVSPCGACRQVISEFSNKDTRIIMSNKNYDYKVWDVEEMIPDAFGPEDL